MTANFFLGSALPYAWASSPERLAVAAGVTVMFAVIARMLRGVDRSGALAGGFACLLFFIGVGPWAFAMLSVLFVMTWATTRLGYRRKVALGVAEPREGRRALQVLANLIVAAASSLAFGITGSQLLLTAMLAALCEAATDTVASEIGQYRGKKARLITTWEHVEPGTDGGITIVGSAAGLLAGLAIAIVAAASGLVHPAQLWIPLTAGFAGMLFDSVLGATLQRRCWIGNQTVNFFATLAGAVIGCVLGTFFKN